MNSCVVKDTKIVEDYLDDSKGYSPSKSKRIRLEDDGCNNNLNSSFNSSKWSCSGDTSLVEPEILEDMGVSMLEDEETNQEDIQKLSLPQDNKTSPSKFDNSQLASTNSNNLYDDPQSVYKSSSFKTASIERLDSNSHDFDDPGDYGCSNNESGYASRVDTFGETKESFSKDNSNTSLEKYTIDQFYLYRRKKKPSITGEDEFNKLSDEMILMILQWLPKKCLVRSMLVCKRWYQIARDEVLWTRLDLGGKVLNIGTLGYILPRGIQILRLAQAEIADPIFLDNSEMLGDNYFSKLQYLDLSMAVISPNGLAILLSKCKYLKKLSLEKCNLKRASCKAISLNEELEVLNLTMCEGMDFYCIKYLVKLERLTALNLSWCSLDSETMLFLCKSLPSSITRINIAGCRKTMTDDNVKNIVKACPDIIELDLSDCTMLTMASVNCILELLKLEHLSLSRCYSIPIQSYLRIIYMPSLMHLDVFGLMSVQVLKSLQANAGDTAINTFLYSTIARPTVGYRRSSIWGIKVKD